MAEQRGWIVTTSSERPIRDIVSDLTEAGFSVGRVLEKLGSITGTATDDAITKLRSIRGVVSVSPDRAVSIGPSDWGEN